MAGNIRELSAPRDLGLQPSDRAAESTANAGRRIAGLYGQAAEATASIGRSANSAINDVGDVAVKYMDHREISAGAPAMATALTNLDQAWNKTAKGADPNDPSVAAKFREEVLEPNLEKLRGGFNTDRSQAWADAQIDSMRNHFITKTSSDMATMAGIAAKQNIVTLTNQLSNAAISDPTSLNTSLDMVEHSIGAMVDSSPNLRGVDGAKLKADLLQSAQSDIVKAAAIGAIGVNPEAGLAKFSSPEYSKYISGSELKQLEQQAKIVRRAERADQSYQHTMEKQQKQDASDNRERQYLSQLHSGDPEQAKAVSAKNIANDMDLTREASERMINIIERESRPETDAKVSRATTVELFNKMRNEGDSTDPMKMKNWVDDAYAAGRLTWGDRTNLTKEVEDRKTPEGLALAQDRAQFFKQYAGAIANKTVGADGKMEIYDPMMGSPKLYAAERDARRVEQDLKQRGLDPHLAYDPTSEYFLGKAGRVQKWRGSLQDDLTTRAAPGNGFPADKDIVSIDRKSEVITRDAPRTPGNVYETPQGKLKWTGTGWVKP